MGDLLIPSAVENTMRNEARHIVGWRRCFKIDKCILQYVITNETMKYRRILLKCAKNKLMRIMIYLFFIIRLFSYA